MTALLDLYCCAGGAAVGYHRAGFTDIVGVDIRHQKNYPYDFVLDDALAYLRHIIGTGEIERFDLIHASPPCQAYSVTSPLSNGNHPELVAATRRLLRASGKPYVIENVPGAPLNNPLMLCGTMFPGLKVIRHRLFECWPAIWFPPAICNHNGTATGNRRRKESFTRTASLEDGFSFVTVVGNDFLADEGREAMGIDWTTKKELSQAIPPAYTDYIGRKMLQHIAQGVAQ